MPRLGLQETSREIVPASSSSRSFDNMAGLSAPVAAFEGGQVVVRAGRSTSELSTGGSTARTAN